MGEKEKKKTSMETSSTSSTFFLRQLTYKRHKKTNKKMTGGPATRGAAVAFGAGFGLGSAYADGRKEVRKRFFLMSFLLSFSLFFSFASHRSTVPNNKNKTIPAPRGFPCISSIEQDPVEQSLERYLRM